MVETADRQTDRQTDWGSDTIAADTSCIMLLLAWHFCTPPKIGCRFFWLVKAIHVRDW